jgi:hypothetical protein
VVSCGFENGWIQVEVGMDYASRTVLATDTPTHYVLLMAGGYLL